MSAMEKQLARCRTVLPPDPVQTPQRQFQPVSHVPSSSTRYPRPFRVRNKVPQPCFLELFADTGNVDRQGVVIDEALPSITTGPGSALPGIQGSFCAQTESRRIRNSFLDRDSFSPLYSSASLLQIRHPHRPAWSWLEVAGRSYARRSTAPILAVASFHAEGLAMKIISAHAQRHHLVHLVGGGGEEYNGHPADLPDLGAPVIAAEIGEGDVHRHQIRLCLFKFLRMTCAKLLHIGRLGSSSGSARPVRRQLTGSSSTIRILYTISLQSVFWFSVLNNTARSAPPSMKNRKSQPGQKW